MAWQALQKRVKGLFSSRRHKSSSSSPSEQPCATTSGASEHNEKVQGRRHRAAARGDLAWLRRWRWNCRRVGIDPPDQQSRTAVAVTTSQEADVEEDKLRLPEKLEKVEVELDEMEENHLNFEHYFQIFKAAVEEKDRILAAALELQDQMSAYFERVQG